MTDTTRTLFTSRPYAGEADLQPIADLVNACSDYDNLDDTVGVGDLRRDFGSPVIDQERDLRLWFDADGRLAAFGALGNASEGDDGVLSTRLYLKIRPDARDMGLEDQVIDWAAERLASQAREKGLPAHLHTGTRDFDTYGRRVFEEHGFTPERYFFRMERSLNEPLPEPVFPEGYTLSYVQDDGDQLKEWIACFAESFIDHWHFTPITYEEAVHWNTTNPHYKAESDLVAVAPDGTFAGFCYCEVDEEDNARNNRNIGWIHLLGTRRGHRKIGLGKALLYAGFKRLKALGAESAWLGVDAENPTGALGLYESVGFEKRVTNVVYGKDILTSPVREC